MAVGRTRDDSQALGGVTNGYAPLNANLLIPSTYVPSNVGGLHLLEQHTASSSATLDFTTFTSTTYDEYIFEFISVVPATDSTDFYIRMSTDGGATFDTGANYGTTLFAHAVAGTANSGNNADTKIMIRNSGEISNSAARGGVNGELRLFDPLGTTSYKRVIGNFTYWNSSSFASKATLGAIYSSTSAVNAIRFFFSSGNITSGTIRVYGINKAIASSTGVKLSDGLQLLEQHTALSSATLDFTSFINSNYDEYEIEFINVVPATNSVAFWMRMSTDNGSSYDSGNNYGWAAWTYRAGGSGQTGSEGGASKIQLGYNTDIDNTATSGITGSIRLFSPQSTALWKMITGELAYRSGGNRVDNKIRGSYESTTAITSLQFLMSSGNIASGIIRIYGVAKSVGTSPTYSSVVGGFAPLNSSLQIPASYVPSNILGATTYSTGSDTAWATVTSATATDIDATNAALTVTIPASGKVVVTVDIEVGFNYSVFPWGPGALCIKNGSTVLQSLPMAFYVNIATDARYTVVGGRFQGMFVLTGLTPGSMTLKVALRGDGSNGVSAFANDGAGGSGHYAGPFNMVVWGA